MFKSHFSNKKNQFASTPRQQATSEYESISAKIQSLQEFEKHEIFRYLLTVEVISINSGNIQTSKPRVRITYCHNYEFVTYLEQLFHREGIDTYKNTASKVYWSFAPSLQQVLQQYAISSATYNRFRPLLEKLDSRHEQTLTQPLQVKVFDNLVSANHTLSIVYSSWALDGIILVLKRFVQDIQYFYAKREGSPHQALQKIAREYDERCSKSIAAAEREIAEIGQRFNLSAETIQSSYRK